MPNAPETLVLNPADFFLRLFMCMLLLLCSSCTPSTTASSNDALPPPPQCVLSYVFVDLEGNDAFVCVYDDTSEDSWNGYGVTVFHPYLDGFIVGLAVDLPSLCSGDTPVCMTEPWTQCVAPLQSWSAEGHAYVLCRTNDGDDTLELYGEVRHASWSRIAAWETSIVCVE